MKSTEHALGTEEVNGLNDIVAFVRRQRALVRELRKTLGEHAHVFALRDHAPKSVEALNGTWTVTVHGVGVRFTNIKTRESIDAHVGLLEFDGAFDVWRLEEHAGSIRSTIHSFEPIVEQLYAKGAIQRHESLEGHYELVSDYVTGE